MELSKGLRSNFSVVSAIDRSSMSAFKGKTRWRHCGTSRKSFTQFSGCRRLNLAQPPLEEPAFAVVGDQRERAFVAFGGFGLRAEAAQQIGADGVQQMGVVERGAGRA